MKFISKFNNFVYLMESFQSEIQELNDICLDIEDNGFNIVIKQLTEGENPFATGDNQVILIKINDFRKGYLSSFQPKDLIETLERVSEFAKLTNLKLEILTHRKNHNNIYEPLKLYGGGLMDDEMNYLDYPIYWLELILRKK